MKLQKGLVTAEQLAASLEVSVRTIYRDMDQLSFAGVPVYADRGRAGGFQLLDGWKMPPTGLTGIEAEALLLSGMPDQVRQLGLHPAMISGQNKLSEALSEQQRGMVGKISSYIYVDPVSWFGREEPADKLHELMDAVWNCRRLLCVYESWKGEVERVINPLGLVVKGGTWYLAGEVEGDERIYRAAKFKEITVKKETFERPQDFDLRDCWRRAVARYEANIYEGNAKLKVSKQGFELLSELGGPVSLAAQNSVIGPDPEGNFVVSIPIETISRACSDILRLGPECKVLEPPQLVDKIRQVITEMSGFYGNVPAK